MATVSIVTSTVAVVRTYRNSFSKEKRTHSFVRTHKAKESVQDSLLTMMMPNTHEELRLVMHYGRRATSNFTEFLMVRELFDRIHPMSKHKSVDFQSELPVTQSLSQ